MAFLLSADRSPEVHVCYVISIVSIIRAAKQGVEALCLKEVL